MNIDDKKEFNAVWLTTLSMYDKTANENMVNMAFGLLSKYEIIDIKAAIQRHMQDPDAGMFAPKVANIVRQIQGSNESQSMIAWSKVDLAIRSIGTYQDVIFDDPIIHSVIRDMGGWIKLGQTTENDFKFLVNQFNTRYRAYAQNPPMDYPKLLTGIANASNAVNGHDLQQPTLIGDQYQAKLTYKNGNKNASIPTDSSKSVMDFLLADDSDKVRLQ